jgi:hypothetical protein
MVQLSEQARRELELYCQKLQEREIEQRILRNPMQVPSIEELKEDVRGRGGFVRCFDIDSNLKRLETENWIICIQEMGEYCILFSYRNPDSISVSAEERAAIRKVAEDARFPHNADEEAGALHILLEYVYFTPQREPLILLFKKHLWWRMDWAP